MRYALCAMHFLYYLCSVKLVPNDILIPEMARMLREGHEVRFTPSGVSMRPFIEGGKDSVILRRLPRPARVGDVVLGRMEPEGIFVLHRVLRLEEDGVVILQGDGNLRGEERILPDNQLGTVVRIESPRGYRKPILRAKLWQRLMPVRWFLLKVYRHTILKWFY